MQLQLDYNRLSHRTRLSLVQSTLAEDLGFLSPQNTWRLVAYKNTLHFTGFESFNLTRRVGIP